jgi:hypothetical protein
MASGKGLFAAPAKHGRGGGLFTAAKKKDKDRGGVLGFVENLAGDAAEAIVGLPAGLAETARNPIKTAKAVGQSYADTYGPLFDGDYGEFFSNVYKHPLGPILDLATVLTLGGAAYGRAGLAASKGGLISLESPAAKAGVEGALIVSKNTARNPVIRARQVALDKFMKQFPADTPILGEYRRLARELDKVPRREAMSLQVKLRPYQRAYNKLSEGEQIALGLIGRGLTPDEYKALLQREAAAGTKVEAKTLALLDRADVRAAVANPSAKLVDAVAKAKAAGEAAASVLVQHRRLTPETAAERPYLAARIARAEDVKGAPAELFPADDVAARATAGAPAPLDDVLRTAPTVETIQAEFAAKGRIQPFFLPDQALREMPYIGRSGGGLGVPRTPVRKSEAVLLRTGMLALQPDLLSASYLKAVKYALYDDIHTLLMDSAVRVPRGEGLPPNHVFIRRPVGKSGRPESISYTERVTGEFRESLDELLDDDALTGESLTTKSAADAEIAGGYLLAVPESMAKRAAGEFLQSSKAARWFLQKPVAVWRALVLNLRPAWLVNNIVGNHLLYAIKYSGPKGLAAYARAVKAVGKETDEFRKLLTDRFPEQIEGTFIQTQRPGKFGRAQNIASVGLAPLDRGVEGVLRRAATETELRRHPQVRAFLKNSGRERGSFERAARKALDKDPLLAREISDRVNSALGNFLDMSPTEQTVLRSLFPFYAWYKAIARVVFKMPLDTPGRTAILAKLGQIGAADTFEKLGDLPAYLRGAIPIGRPSGDRARVVNTGPVNPFATANMIVAGLTALAAGKPGQIGQDVGGTINPFIAALAETAFGTDIGTGAPVQGRGGVLGSILGNVGGGLPQKRLIDAVMGTLYQGTTSQPTLYDRNTRDELLAYLGVPYRDLSLKRAGQLAEEE